jgi:hypothetical protein
MGAQLVEVELRTLELCADELSDRFLLRPRNVTFLHAGQGTGKTKLMRHALEKADGDGKRTLWLFNKRLYSRAVAHTLDFADYTHADYCNTEEGNRRLLAQPRLILSLESLLRLESAGTPPHRFDRIVLDEFEELHFLFASATMQGKRWRVFRLLVALLREADQIWVADADMTVDVTLRFFAEHVGDQQRTTTYIFNRCQTLVRDYCFVRSWEHMALLLWRQLAARKRVWAPSNSKQRIVTLHAWLQQAQVASAPPPLPPLPQQPDEEEEEEEEKEEKDAHDEHTMQAAADADAAAAQPPLLRMRLLTGECTQYERQTLMDARFVREAWQHDLMLVSPVVGSGVSFQDARASAHGVVHRIVSRSDL